MSVCMVAWALDVVRGLDHSLYLKQRARLLAGWVTCFFWLGLPKSVSPAHWNKCRRREKSIVSIMLLVRPTILPRERQWICER